MIRNLVTLLLLAVSISAFSQDEDVVFRSSIYPTEDQKYYVYSDVANVRGGAGTEFDVIDKLACGDEITVLEYDRDKQDIVNKLGGSWVKISYTKSGETKYGYLWELNLSKTQLRRGDVKFVFGIDRAKSKDDYYAYVGQVKAVSNGKIISRTQFETSTTPLVQGSIMDNSGLEKVEKVINIYLSGEACGEPIINCYIAWDGKDLKYMTQTVSAGDIEEGHIEHLIFPSGYYSGSSSVLIKLTDDFYRVASENEDEIGIPEADHDYKSEVYVWDGNKLILQKQSSKNEE